MSKHEMPDAAFAAELEPVAAELLTRHLANAKPWYPHEMIDYDNASSFKPGETIAPEALPFDRATTSALLVNLLTEDNLPYYFQTIDGMYGGEGAWGEWNRRWTAEEGRHSIVIRDHLITTRALDPRELEDSRMKQVSRGEVPNPPSAADGIAYVALQELATRIAHRNTGKKLKEQGDVNGYEVMKRVAADENLHHLFYRDLGSAALELDPSAMIIAIDRQVRHFEMPGTGIPNFLRHAVRIARAGIYDLDIHFNGILDPVLLRKWKLDKIQGLTPEADKIRESLLGSFMLSSSEDAKRVLEKKQERQALSQEANI